MGTRPRILPGMARTKRDRSGSDAAPAKQGRFKQLWLAFTMTRKSDPAVVWWMLGTFAGTVAVGYLLGLAIGHPIYLTVLSVPLGLMLALLIMARRAERAAYAQLAGQPGAAGAALGNLRRGWNVEQQPVAVDPRTQDLVFRAVGRAGVVLVTEGPTGRAGKLAENERKRIARVLGESVPVAIVHSGDGEGQVPLRKLSAHVMRMRPTLSKDQVAEIHKRLRALGATKPPIPKGIDPTRVRPDRRATRGR
jgi:Domain of unknown function (DUF4191)